MIASGSISATRTPTTSDKNGVVIYMDPITGPETFSRFFARDKIPGVAPYTGDLTYDHTVPLPGGSKVVLSGQARWSSPYDMASITPPQLAVGGYQYIRNNSAWIGDLYATWLSDSERYSVTGYVRNVGDDRYKTLGPGLAGETAMFTSTVNLSDPRTYGVVLSARF